MSGPSPYMPETALNAPQSIIPPSLTPGRQRARIWDKSAAQRPRTSHGSMTSPYYSPQRSSLYGDYFFSQPQASLSPPPPLPQKPRALLKPLTNPLPPIPPKPPALAIAPASRIPLYPTVIPLPVVGPSSLPSEPIASETVPPPDEKETEAALTLSASKTRNREQELIAQEDEELARALEESRLLTSSVYSLDEQSPTSPRPPSIDRTSISAIKGSAHPPEGESWLHMITPTASTSSQDSFLNEDFTSSHSSVNKNESDDDPSDFLRGTPNDVQSSHTARDSLSPTPPLYANIVSNLVRSPLPTPSPSHLTVASSSPVTPSTYLQSDYTPSLDRVPSSPSLSLTQSSSSEQSPMPPFSSRPSWSSVSSESSTPAGRCLGSELLPASSGYKSPTYQPASPDLSLGSSPSLDPLDEEVEEEADTEPGPSTRPAVPLSANHYVEREMLMGVSLGFNIPVISTELLPMAGVMPNVITLPYGKAPIFHFQASSWRKLLKLMARLSGTRVEPTVEALSIAKHDLKLRTVIQFVKRTIVFTVEFAKIHHSASEWRTVLYLTTDHPIPSNLPNSHKYTNGDVSVLPYSYTLSPLPTLLRDGSESPMAKYYVVPSTPTTPYPNLPINFPNLAMYLQSAVQDSRRAANDSSSGLRKLAHHIDSCYRTEAGRVAPIDQEVFSKRGVGGMFKRVMGRNKANKGSTGNEEIYDLVTPFVSDEWG
ncbi:hypothetical protein J3R83DRAFT_877 [Lanmaoa asiatica]|nr:hypothetical protein J3R83DRAFT_877 [Lanmaoa asiatica]